MGPSHTFADLAKAIDGAFARWDLSHLSLFTLADGRNITDPETGAEIESSEVGTMPPRSLDLATTKVMATVRPGEPFRYVFDLGDQWTHRCTVAEERIDPREEYGVVPTSPAAYWGWGDIPDQYGRRWDADNGNNRPPKRPQGSDPMLDFGWPEQEVPRLPVSLPDLREAAYRNDPESVAAALEGHDLSAVLQQAGAAVLSEYGRDPDRLSSLAFSLHNRLTDRGLPGDTELAALLLAVLQGKPLPEPTLPVELDELGELLEGDPAMGSGGYLDRTTGEVIDSVLTDEAMVGDAYVDIEDDPDRWLYIPREGSRAGWEDMAAYIDTVPDTTLQDRLWRAIEGKGAFRRFRDLIHEEDLADSWYSFSADRRIGRARAYLADEGIQVA